MAGSKLCLESRTIIDRHGSWVSGTPRFAHGSELCRSGRDAGYSESPRLRAHSGTVGRVLGLRSRIARIARHPFSRSNPVASVQAGRSDLRKTRCYVLDWRNSFVILSTNEIAITPDLRIHKA